MIETVVVLHEITVYESPLGTHPGTFREIWENILEN